MRQLKCVAFREKAERAIKVTTAQSCSGAKRRAERFARTTSDPLWEVTIDPLWEVTIAIIFISQMQRLRPRVKRSPRAGFQPGPWRLHGPGADHAVTPMFGPDNPFFFF